ncbi:HTH-type transcriptional regulator DmlR [Vibrio quintilis]|uniref:HTH-type transcriptional regulator DmlR n=1 Tax=Vibrio quintilis TaxID=1117707 RepID=A0A1M7YX93_9VIBR|nr:HTH-type transcriptional regulator DmlR [Vibrio quintilis]
MTMKMSVPTISGELLLADTVAEFCQMNPGLTIDMSLNNQFVDLVEGGYDLVIRTNNLEDSSLIARHILNSQWVVCVSPEYLAHSEELYQPADLVNHNCLLYTGQTTGANEWEFIHHQQRYFIRVSGNLSTDNAVALRKAVLSGYGIAYVPRCLVYQDLQQGLLNELFAHQAGKNLGVYAVYPFTRQPQNKVRLLIEHIRTRYLDIGHYFSGETESTGIQ